MLFALCHVSALLVDPSLARKWVLTNIQDLLLRPPPGSLHCVRRANTGARFVLYHPGGLGPQNPKSKIQGFEPLENPGGFEPPNPSLSRVFPGKNPENPRPWAPKRIREALGPKIRVREGSGKVKIWEALGPKMVMASRTYLSSVPGRFAPRRCYHHILPYVFRISLAGVSGGNAGAPFGL